MGALLGLLVYLLDRNANVVFRCLLDKTRSKLIRQRMSDVFVGIDLGTSNSSISYIRKGSSAVHTVEANGHSYPSTVKFLPDGGVAPCVEVVMENNYGFALNSKRLIGRSFHEPDIQQSLGSFGTTVRECRPCSKRDKMASTHECGYVNPYSGAVEPAVNISSMILKHIKEAAEKDIGEPITKALITVPVVFTWEQRMETVRAAKLAGIQVTSVEPEPVMAAFDYCVSNEIKDGRFVVYDFGGGTFDLTLVSVENGKYVTSDISGDPDLGGENITMAIMKAIESAIASALHKENIYEGLDELRVRSNLHCYAEQVKVAMTDISETVVVNTSVFYEGWSLKLPVNFDIDSVKEPVLRTIKLTKQLVDNCCTVIDRIIMIGGSSEFSFCRSRMEATFPGMIERNSNSYHCVSRGAAMCASLFPAGFDIHDNEVMFRNQLRHRLGYLNASKVPTYVFNKGDPLPKKRRERVRTTERTSFIRTTIIEEKDDGSYRKCTDLVIRLNKPVEKRTILYITFFVSSDLMLYYEIQSNNNEVLVPLRRISSILLSVCCVIVIRGQSSPSSLPTIRVGVSHSD